MAANSSNGEQKATKPPPLPSPLRFSKFFQVNNHISFFVCRFHVIMSCQFDPVVVNVSCCSILVDLIMLFGYDLSECELRSVYLLLLMNLVLTSLKIILFNALFALFIMHLVYAIGFFNFS